MAPTPRSPITLLALAAGALLLGYVGAGMYLAGLENAPKPNNNVVFQPGLARGERIKGHSWSADYGRIVASADQTILDVWDVKHGIIYKNGKPYLFVQAKHMTINSVTHDFDATGDLHIETADPNAPKKTFVTDAASWNDATQRLILPHKSLVESGMDLPLTVGNLTLDVRTGQIELNKVAGSVRFK